MVEAAALILAAALVTVAAVAGRAMASARHHRAARQDLQALVDGMSHTAEARIAELEALRERVDQLEQVAVEHDDCSDADELQLVDADTGLHTGLYFQASLRDRLAAARRHLRPVTVVLVELAPATAGGRDLEPDDGPVVARCLNRTLRESDVACRLDSHRFVLLLEDTADTSAVWAIERLRRHIQIELPLRVTAGIASYPTHGLAADEVMQHAEDALDQATKPSHDGIQVARSES